MGIFKGPKAPDPIKTAQAQAAQNKETAVTQAGLNMVNQITPDGSLSYRQIGTWEDGTPRFEATQSLSEAGQVAKGQEQQIDQSANQLAIDQLGRLTDHLGQPINLSNDAVEGRLMELGSKRLDPRFAEEQQRLESDLVNRGIRPGTAAYESMMRSFNESKNDAYNQLMLTGRGQSVQEILAERNQPINEVGALMGLGQVQQPNFTSTPQTGVQGTDVAGLIQSNYQQKLGQHNAMMGGLFSLGSAAIGMSDMRLKTDIEPVGVVNGLTLCRFKYVWGGPEQLGFMAQEVERLMPDAVLTMSNGYKAVDYAKVLN